MSSFDRAFLDSKLTEKNNIVLTPCNMTFFNFLLLNGNITIESVGILIKCPYMWASAVPEESEIKI